MARKSKFEEEKNRLDGVRKRLDEAIEEVENIQHSFGNNDLYEQAIIHREIVKKLREIRTACGEDKKENE